MTKQAKRDPKRARSSAGGAFARFELRHELNQAIEAAGYEEPRPIQAKGIPPAMQGRDVLAELGVPPGPQVGDLLRRAEALWLAEDFRPDRAELLQRLRAMGTPNGGG